MRSRFCPRDTANAPPPGSCWCQRARARSVRGILFPASAPGSASDTRLVNRHEPPRPRIRALSDSCPQLRIHLAFCMRDPRTCPAWHPRSTPESCHYTPRVCTVGHSRYARTPAPRTGGLLEIEFMHTGQAQSPSSRLAIDPRVRNWARRRAPAESTNLIASSIATCSMWGSWDAGRTHARRGRSERQRWDASPGHSDICPPAAVLGSLFSASGC
ncbi:hypothetical protein C8Q78DRAFT_259916 [Trametes maxima]|nr:hypothetical protein C8Q78DRAFT_259916 [Trametes maxima]